MNAKTYCRVSGTLFILMAVVHIWRVVTATPIDVAGSAFPMSVSIGAAIVTLLLGIWAFKSAGSIPQNPA
jgi:hypothetical protein